MNQNKYNQWAWSYASDVIRADQSAGYYDAPQNMDREKCSEALYKVIEEMRKIAKKYESK